MITSSGLALGVAGVFLAGMLCAPAWAQAYPPAGPQQGQQVPAGPPQGPPVGMLNYVEGQVSVAGQPVSENSVRTTQLGAGQTLSTQNGRAEVLLTPGVLMRVDNNSAVLMTNPGIADTDATVEGGRAMVEADMVMKDSHIDIREGPATVRLVTHGLYDFDAAHGMLRVFDGRAEVTVAGKTHTLQGGHEFNLNEAKLHARGFDKKANEDAFYRWSSLRSSYLAEANADAARGFAQGYYGNAYYGGAPYYGYAAYGAYPGWWWDPYWGAYTWLPWDGIFFSPFGFGFYAPGFAYAAPFYGFHGGYHYFGPAYHPSIAPRAGGSMAMTGGAARGFAAGRAGGFAGGGFRGNSFAGGGGFHGGGGFGGGGGRR